MTARTTPRPPEDEHFWEAARRGALEFQQCMDCRYVRWPAAGVCPECLGRRSAWVPVDGRGTVWSTVTYHRSYGSADLPVPYNVVLVELDSGPRLLSRVVGERAGDVVPGTRVEVRFEDDGLHGVVPVFVVSGTDALL